ncbi:hypothetical protein JTE90_011940 [Oedothorax gibbosus]|uniref:Uncharacterized protein n=1 Tax=Oedothorax gibbosus TaxID=931172 RepID=A0AAV6V157_9ARAC|nr:hypothetical protein JTE90_011940 [Oedothorax gibbosus]
MWLNNVKPLKHNDNRGNEEKESSGKRASVLDLERSLERGGRSQSARSCLKERQRFDSRPSVERGTGIVMTAFTTALVTTFVLFSFASSQFNSLETKDPIEQKTEPQKRALLQSNVRESCLSNDVCIC